MVNSSNSLKRDNRREAIFGVARALFFELGYDAVSMSAIAARLGGSKGTLYHYFTSKEELFIALVEETCATFTDLLVLDAGSTTAPEETLRTFANDYLRFLLSESSVKLFRILMAESQRRPQLTRTFYAVGPARGLKALETYFEGATARGELHISDCGAAADQFLNLCKGSMHLKFVLNLIPSPTDPEIEIQAREAVHMFMRAYGSGAKQSKFTALEPITGPDITGTHARKV